MPCHNYWWSKTFQQFVFIEECHKRRGVYWSCDLLLIAVSYRLAKYQAFKNFNQRILVATDLFGRGMDIERVNIVINYDMPEDSDSYLHRVSNNV